MSFSKDNAKRAAVQAGKVYRWQLVEAAIMKWVHLGFDREGCVMGIVSRDANYLNSIPRLTKDVVLVAANRSVVAHRHHHLTLIITTAYGFRE